MRRRPGARLAWPDRIAYREEPVDATRVPGDLEGFRTLFGSFHHFRPETARGILRDAVRKRQGISILEFTERNPLIWGPPLLLGWAFVWLVTPLIRPFNWLRLFWTYMIPVWFLFAFWDGVVSCLRTYSPRELRDLTADLGGEGYAWEIGRVRAVGMIRVTYLLGIPNTTGARDA